MPLRSNIAVPIELYDAVLYWYREFVPAMAENFEPEKQGTCKIATTYVGHVDYPTFKHDIRFISNPSASHGKHDVKAFVDYIRGVEDVYTGVDWGWTSWYDRHLG